MTIIDFFERCVGRWFSHRTSYQLDQTDHWHRSDKTHIFQEVLPADATDVIHLCELQHIETDLALGGLRHSWEKSLTQPAGSVLWVPLAELSPSINGLMRTNMGRMLRALHGSAPIMFHYEMRTPDTLWLSLNHDLNHGQHLEERIWFAGPNLRLRTTLIASPNQTFHFSSFYSEIRMGDS